MRDSERNWLTLRTALEEGDFQFTSSRDANDKEQSARQTYASAKRLISLRPWNLPR
jgi:hypothetical protein